MASDNGSSGVKAGADACFFAGNHLTDNSIGLLLDTTGNMAVGNTARGNDDEYDVPQPGNHFELSPPPGGNLPLEPWTNFEL